MGQGGCSRSLGDGTEELSIDPTAELEQDQTVHPTPTLYKISAYLPPQIQINTKEVEKPPNGLKSDFQLPEGGAWN